MTTLTKNDIGVTWTDLVTDLSLVTDTSYTIQNVSPYPLEIKEKATAPSTDEFGKVITPNSFWATTANSSIGIYIRNQNYDDKKLGKIAVDIQNPMSIKSNGHIGEDVEGLGTITVGTTPVELSFTGTTESIIITSENSNTGLIYIGKSDVQSDGSNSITGLDVSQSFTIDYNASINPLYIVSDTASQTAIAGAVI